MHPRSVSEQQFRRHIAQVRAQFVDLYARDPEQALEKLLENVGELKRDAVRLGAAFGFGITEQLIATSRSRVSKAGN
jgi:hypothetical protein